MTTLPIPQNATGPIGAPVQNPLDNLQSEFTPSVAKYVGVLEAQLAAYAINEAKYRTMLELLTGDSWDTTKVDVDGTHLMDMAIDSLVKKGMDPIEARNTVAKRWNEHNQPMQPTTAATQQPIEPKTMEQRFADWSERKRSQGFGESSTPTTESDQKPAETPA